MKSIKFNTSYLKIIINNNVSKILNSYKQIRKNINENGGVLMGELYPSSNKIIITHALVCNNQSSLRHSVNLNTKCLQKKILKIWKESNGRITYLGDWHTHPENKPSPSLTDYKTFVKNYYTSKFDQNILLYVILGKKNTKWVKLFNGILFCSINLNHQSILKE